MPSESAWTPTYGDGGIVLNGYTADDIEDHLAAEDEETAHRFGWWPKRSTRATVERAFLEWADSWRNKGPVHTFAVREEASGKLLGGCQLRKLANGCAEVSYWTGAPYRGHRFAQQALRLLCLHARHEGISHLEAHISLDNPASQAVAIAVGFTAEDHFHDGVNVMIRFVLDQALSRVNT